MGRAYNVIDSDGHILEPLTLRNDYMDPAPERSVSAQLLDLV